MLPGFKLVDAGTVANRIRLLPSQHVLQSWKPYVSLQVKDEQKSEPSIVTFLLDTGSDFALLPRSLYSVIRKASNSRTGRNDVFNISTIPGSLTATLTTIEVRYPITEGGIGAFQQLQVGIVDQPTSLSRQLERILKSFKQLFQLRAVSTAIDLASAVKAFQNGKIGILAGRDFQSIADHYLTADQLFVAKKGTFIGLAKRLNDLES